MDDNYHHCLYAKLPLPNTDEDEVNHWDNEIYTSLYMATVPWDLSSYYTVKYNHLDWCCRSFGCWCNLKNRESE